MPVLPALGTVGLILIVLEGALELEYNEDKKSLILQSFFAAAVILLITTFSLTYLFYYTLDVSFRAAYLNAIPFSVISSAIAIPSVKNLSNRKKEFVIYESSLSDVLGIVLFNFAEFNEEVNLYSFVNLGLDTLLVAVISAGFCIFLLYLFGRMPHHNKFFLIISTVILIFAVAKQFHLSSLIIVMVFGLFLNNLNLIQNKWFQKNFLYERFEKDLDQLKLFTGESAFLIRTFFFVVFGFTFTLNSLLDTHVLLYGAATMLTIYIIRLVYLFFFTKKHVMPEVYIAPRGLISILLFFSIPAKYQIDLMGNGLLFFVVLGTSIIMSFGLLNHDE